MADRSLATYPQWEQKLLPKSFSTPFLCTHGKYISRTGRTAGIYKKYLSAMEKEYNWWMEGESNYKTW